MIIVTPLRSRHAQKHTYLLGISQWQANVIIFFKIFFKIDNKNKRPPMVTRDVKTEEGGGEITPKASDGVSL